MTELHPGIALQKPERHRFRRNNLEGQSVDVRKLISLRIDFTIIGIPHKGDLARRWRTLQNPSLKSRFFPIPPLGFIVKKLIPSGKSEPPSFVFQMLRINKIGMKTTKIMPGKFHRF